jgi:hypothetical protein
MTEDESWKIIERPDGTFLLKENCFDGGAVYSTLEAAKQCLNNFKKHKQ